MILHAELNVGPGEAEAVDYVTYDHTDPTPAEEVANESEKAPVSKPTPKRARKPRAKKAKIADVKTVTEALKKATEKPAKKAAPKKTVKASAKKKAAPKKTAKATKPRASRTKETTAKRGPKGLPESKRTRQGSINWGLRVKKAREAKGLRQWELAERVGIKQPHMCNIETAMLKPSDDLRARVEKALGIKRPPKKAVKKTRTKVVE